MYREMASINNIDIPSVPRLRTVLNSFRFVRVPLEVLDGYLKGNGDTMKIFIGGVYPAILTTNPEIIQHVLQKNHRNYKKSSIQLDTLARYLGHGLLTSEGEYWLRQRRLIQPGFHRQRLGALCELMLDVIDERLDRLARQSENGAPADMYPHMMETAFRIMARSLFSVDMPEEELRALSKHITALQEFMIREIRQPFMKPWFRLNGQMRRHLRLTQSVRDIILRYIRERRRSGESRDDLLQMLLDVRYEDTGEAMSESQILDEAIILLVAGHETSACALAWTCYLLGRHPEAARRMRAEYDAVLGASRPNFDDLAQLTYTLQVIEESMRLYPPAWITDRIAIDDDEVAGLPIPAGMVMAIYIYGAHRSAAVWEDSERFDPERFEKNRRKAHPPFSYLPFGGGPRLCIGNNFALMEMQLVMARLLRRFDLELLPGQSINPLPLITMRPKEGVRMRLSARAPTLS
jgi:cytochrome P450